MTFTLIVPDPGVDLVPDGWCDSTVVPWLAEQTDAESLNGAAARLDGLIAAYRTLDADTLELSKARRYLELRWGELLGPGTPGQHAPSHASEGALDYNERYRFRLLAENRELVVQRLREATDADEVTRSALLRSLAHIRSNAGENEWYTPPAYIEAAVAVMGAIDLDPATSTTANAQIGAAHFYTPEDDGLFADWQGRVWMNPPYARPLIDHFCAKLADSYANGGVSEACVLVNNATETGWFQALAEMASAFCFPRGRVKFWHPDRVSAPLQGQAVIYLGENVSAFRQAFGRFGFTVIA